MATYNKDGGGAKRQTYFFNGKSYYTYAAYKVAVNAAAKAKADAAAAAVAAAKTAAAAAAAKTSREAAMRQQQAAIAARSKTAQQVAAAAKTRSAAVAAAQRLRLESDAAAQAALQRQALAREAAARKAERQRLLVLQERASGRQKEQIQRQLARTKAQDNARVTAMLRKNSYDQLAQRTSAMLAQQRARFERIESRPAVNPQAAYTRQMEQRAALYTRGRQGESGRNPGRLTQSDRNSAQVRQAEKTGDWNGVFARLDEESARSGGLYIDPHLYDLIQRKYVEPVQKVHADYQAVVDEWSAALDAGDEETLVRLALENEDLRKKFQKYFGEGREQGEARIPMAILDKVRQRRESAMLNALGLEVSKGDTVNADRLLRKARIASGPVGLDDAERAYGDKRRTALSSASHGELEFAEQVLDENGRPHDIVSYGLDAYLRREGAREQERARDAYRQTEYQRWRRYEAGDEIIGQDEKGNPIWNSVERRETIDKVADSLGMVPEALTNRWRDEVLDEADYARQDIAKKQIFEDIDRAYEMQKTPEQRARERWARSRSDPESRALWSKAEKEKKAYMDSVAFALTGVKKSGDIDYQGMYAPPLTGLLTAASDPLNSVVNTAGDILNFGGGDVFQRDININFNPLDLNTNPFSQSGQQKSQFLDVESKVLRMNDPEIRREYQNYRAIMDDPNASGELKARAGRRWREVWLTGNVSFLSDVVLDPLNLLGLATKPFQAAKLALKAGEGVGGTLRRTGRYLVPQFDNSLGLGEKLNYFHVRSDQARVAAAAEFGVPAKRVLNFSDGDWQEFLRARRLGEDAIGKTAFGSFLRDSGVDSGQLFNFVQERLPNILRKHGISTIGADEAARMMEKVADAVRSGQSAQHTIEALAREADEFVETAAALEKTRLARGFPEGEEAVKAAKKNLAQARRRRILANKALARVEETNAELAAQGRRATGLSDELNDSLQRIERDIQGLHDSNPMKAAAKEKRMNKIQDTIDQIEARNGKVPQSLRDELSQAEREWASVPGLNQRKLYHELRRERQRLREAVEQNRRSQRIYSVFNSKPWLDQVRGVAHAGKERIKSTWGSGGQHHLGSGLYLSGDDQFWNGILTRVKTKVREGGAGKSKGGGVMPSNKVKGAAATSTRTSFRKEPLARAFYQVNPDAVIETADSLGALRRLFIKYKVPFTGDYGEIMDLAVAMRKAGVDGFEIRNIAKGWRGSDTAKRMRQALEADQVVIWDPAKSGRWIDEAAEGFEDVAPLRKAIEGLDTTVSRAENAVREAETTLHAKFPKAKNPTRAERSIKSGTTRSSDHANPKVAAQLRGKGKKEIKIKTTDADGNVIMLKKVISAEVFYDDIVRDLTRVTREYVSIAERAQTYLDAFYDPHALASERRHAGIEMKKAMQEMEAYENTIKEGVNGPFVEHYGIIAQHQQDLANYYRRAGASPYAPSPTETSWQLLAEDRRFLNQRLVDESAAYNAATTNADKFAAAEALSNIRLALRGVEHEADVLSHGRIPARRFASANVDRIVPAVKPQQIAHFMTTPAHAALGTSHDLNSRIFRISEELPLGPGINQQNVEWLDKFVDSMSGFKAASREVRPGISQTIAKAREFEAFVGRELSLLEAWQIVEYSMASSVWRASYAPLRRELRARVMAEAGRQKFIGKPRDLLRLMSQKHQFADEAVSLAAFKKADAVYARGIRSVRGYTAEGQKRLGAGRDPAKLPPATKSSSVLRDTDPRVLAVKMYLQDEAGMSMYAYDELRTVFSDIMVKENTSKELYEAALKLSKKKGTNLNEENLRLIEGRARREALRNFEEFATRREYVGLPLERVLRIFEEKFILKDLGMAPTYAVSAFKAKALRNAFEEVTGFSHGNLAMRRRWFQGVQQEVEGARLALPTEVSAQFAEKFGHVPIYVVDDELAKSLGFIKGEYEGAALLNEVGEAGQMVTIRGKEVNLKDALPSGIYVTEAGLKNPKIMWHEAFHTFTRNPKAAKTVARMNELLSRNFDLTVLMEHLNMTHTADDLVDGAIAEITSEMYALWKVGGKEWEDFVHGAIDLGAAPLGKKADSMLYDLARAAAKRNGTSINAEYATLKSKRNLIREGHQARAIGEAVDVFNRAEGPDGLFFNMGPEVPPLHNRAAMREWSVATGRWSPATGEDIRTGRRPWSMEEERQYYEQNFGYSPPWTDDSLISVILRDQRAYRRAYREWGFADDAFEKDSTLENLAGSDLQEALAWGKGELKPQRTLKEMREWAVQRYGDLVVDANGNFTSMPWLMKADTEYMTWLRRELSADGRAAFEGSLETARPRMTQFLESQYYDEHGLLRSGGLDIDPKLIGAHGGDPARVIGSLNDAIIKATERRLERMKESSAFVSREWAHQEMLEFTYDITRQLMDDHAWRGIMKGRDLTQQVVHMLGWQRMFVSINPAFPVMNLAESYGYKRGLLAVLHNGWVPMSIEGRKWAHRIRTLEDIGDNEISKVFGTEGKAKFGDRALNRELTTAQRVKAGFDDVASYGVRASEVGETALRLDFARLNYGKSYEALIRSGASDEVADMIARAHARRINMAYFATIGDNPVLNAFNQLVPFFSYRWKQMTLAIRMGVEHPWLPLALGKFQTAIIDHNHDMWIERNGDDVGFDRDDLRNHRLQIDMGDGEPLMIDIWDVSDWTRAMRDVIRTGANGGRISDMAAKFLRAPHPLQQGLWATLTGGITPWGRPGDWREMLWFVDLAEWMMGNDYENPKWQRDGIEMVSQLFFFSGFDNFSQSEQQAATYFALHRSDKVAAKAFFDSHPLVEKYFESLRGFTSPRFDPTRGRTENWYRNFTEDARDEYNAAYEAFNEINTALDAEVFKYSTQPWSAEYREAKKNARAVRMQFLNDNPLLRTAWGLFMTPKEFAELEQDWLVDEQVSTWFLIQDNKPKKGAYDDELAYYTDLSKYNKMRNAWLDAHPQVENRLYDSEIALVRAWHDQELQWSDTLALQANLKKRILEEEAKGADADEDLISVLYEIRGGASDLLDSEAYAQVYTQLLPGKQANRFASLLTGPGRVESFIQIPGFADYRYGNASKEEKQVMVEDEKYYRELGALAEQIQLYKDEDFSDKNDWWGQLEKRGLLDRYLKENPEKKQDFLYVQSIGNIVSHYGKNFWSGLMLPDNAPLLAEYLRRNPEKVGLYHFMRGLDTIWNTIGNDYSRFYSELAKYPEVESEYFRRHPEKAGKGATSAYAQAMGALVKASTSGKDFYERLNQNPWLRDEYFRRHPDKKAKMEQGQEYYRVLSPWIERLKADDFVGAQAAWDKMPAWAKSRYLEGHPNSAMRDGKVGGPGDETPVFTSADARQRFVQGQEYYAAMGTWIELLKAKKYPEAQKHFDSLPSWMKEKYFEKHPDQRAKMELDDKMLVAGANYFLATGSDKLKILRANPALAKWLQDHGGDEAAHRGLVTAIYRGIPKNEPWLKRTFKNAFPEVFSQEASGERKLKKVFRQLAEQPELVPYYEKALALQQRLYIEQLRLNKAAPKPWSIERKQRGKKARRRRAARFSSHWSMHAGLR